MSHEDYNAVGYGILVLYALACMAVAPEGMNPWIGLAIGAAYFVLCWFVGGVYLSCVIHMGIAHRALDYKEWFVKAITVVNNTFGVYVNPVSWVNRHRLHHKFSDHPGDPNKLAADGFWRTLYLCLLPYKCERTWPTTTIFESWSFRLVSNPVFAVFSQVINFGLLWLLVGDLRFAAVMWTGLPGVRAVDQHDPELLDPRPAVRLPPLRRRARQRDEHRRVVAGHRDLQRLPAEQPSPFPGLSALEPRGIANTTSDSWPSGS